MNVGTVGLIGDKLMDTTYTLSARGTAHKALIDTMGWNEKRRLLEMGIGHLKYSPQNMFGYKGRKRK